MKNAMFAVMAAAAVCPKRPRDVLTEWTQEGWKEGADMGAFLGSLVSLAWSACEVAASIIKYGAGIAGGVGT